MKKMLLLMAVTLVLALVMLLAGRQWLLHWGQQPMNVPMATVLEVPKGSSLSHLAQRLEDMEWIQRAELLKLYLRLARQDSRIQAGEYAVAATTSPQQLLQQLAAGEVISYSLTLVDGHSFKQFRQVLKQQPKLKQLTADWSASDILQALNSTYSHPEGLFYPDTYQFTRSDSDLDILRRAYQRMETLLAQAWEQRDPDLPYDSAYEALIMASIIEKETGVPAERPEIAGVFVNRLRRSMRLQTDPTVIYGLGDAYQGNITRQHLRTTTPYNTYRIAGLPPTPIANPGLPAIAAALHPADTDALYFVARGDGSHQFSISLQQHQQAVKKYQLQRRADYRSSPSKETQ